MCRCGASGVGFPGDRHGVERDSGFAREGGDRLAAIADEMISRRHDARQRGADRSAVDLRQNGVEGRALPVAGDENGNVVLMEARMPGLSAALARLSRQIGPPALEGFEDEGFVRLDDSAQRSRLVGGGSAQKPMPPAEGRRRMDAAQFRGLRQALALDHRLGVIEPLLLLAQMRHRRLGQRVERAPAALAAKPQQPVRAAPADDLAARAMRTALALHALNAGRSKRVLAPARLPPASEEPPDLSLRAAAPAFASAAKASPSAPRSSRQSPTAKPKNPQPSSNQPSIRPSLTQINR